MLQFSMQDECQAALNIPSVPCDLRAERFSMFKTKTSPAHALPLLYHYLYPLSLFLSLWLVTPDSCRGRLPLVVAQQPVQLRLLLPLLLQLRPQPGHRPLVRRQQALFF